MSVHYLQNLQKSLQIQNPNVMSMKFKDKCDKQKHYTQLHLSNEKKWFSVQSSVDLSNVCVKKKNLTSNFRCWSIHVQPSDKDKLSAEAWVMLSEQG